MIVTWKMQHMRSTKQICIYIVIVSSMQYISYSKAFLFDPFTKLNVKTSGHRKCVPTKTTSLILGPGVASGGLVKFHFVGVIYPQLRSRLEGQTGHIGPWVELNFAEREE